MTRFEKLVLVLIFVYILTLIGFIVVLKTDIKVMNDLTGAALRAADRPVQLEVKHFYER